MSIVLNNISKSYGGRPVLENLSFEIPDSGIFGIFGGSGCGKTTLIRIICGLEKPDSGSVGGAGKFSVVFQDVFLSDPGCEKGNGKNGCAGKGENEKRNQNAFNVLHFFAPFTLPKRRGPVYRSMTHTSALAMRIA